MKTIFFLSATLVSLTSFAQIRALMHDNYNNRTNAWQFSRHADKMKEVKAGGAKVVFIGDSITHFWEWHGSEPLRKYFSTGDYKMLNLGISGDRTEHVLWRIDEGGELDGYEAKCVLLMIGTNNTGHRPIEKEPPADTILGIRQIVRTIRAKQPKAKIVLTAIFPRGEKATDKLRVRNDVVNREILKLADGKTIFWCDFSDDLLLPDGTLPRGIFPDHLHPNEYGYEAWFNAVHPFIDYALKGGEGVAPAGRFARPRTSVFRTNESKPLFPVSRICTEGYGNRGWWLDRLARNRDQISNVTNGVIDLVFVGDSITHGWEDTGKESYDELKKKYSILNIGYSGDGVEHLLWRLMYGGELDGYKAKCFMVMIGTNNKDDKPEKIAKGIKKVLGLISAKHPDAKILLLPIFPRGEKPDHKERVRNEKANEIIKGFADGEKVILVDLRDKLLDEKGDTKWIMPDRLHPSAEGYRTIWLPAIEPYFEKFVGR